MLLYYIRHGDPIYNPDSLTPLGHRQAESVAKRLGVYGLDRIFASTSNRAIQTATPTSEILKKEIELLDFCNEGHAWGEFTITNEQGYMQWIFQNDALNSLMVSREIKNLGDNWHTHPAFKDTKCTQGVERVNCETDKFLASLGYEHNREKGHYKAVAPNNQRIAIFAHQGFGMAFLSSILDIPYPEICTHFDMTHSAVTVIEFADRDGISIPKVLTLSNDSHLFRDGIPTNYNNYIRF